MAKCYTCGRPRQYPRPGGARHPVTTPRAGKPWQGSGMRWDRAASAAPAAGLRGPARLPLAWRSHPPILRHLARVGGQGIGMPFIDTMTAVVKRVLGTNNETMLRRLMPTVMQVGALEAELAQADDTALRARSAKLKERILAGTSLDEVLPEAFALAREAADRRIGMWNA